MKLNQSGKSELREVIEKELKDYEGDKRVKIDKNILEDLIFEKDIAIFPDGRQIEVKYIVWSGPFLSKIDLSEVSFGSIKENTRLVENQNIFNSRFESIEGQIYEIKRIRDVTFNNSQSFQEIFLYDLILTRNLLEYLILNRKAETGDLVEANMAFAGKEKKFEAKQKAVEFVLSNKLIFSRILEESIGFSSVLLNTMEKHIVTQEEVTSFLKFVVSSNYNELIVKELIKKQKVDFSNPKMSLPAGHIYWKTLEYAEMFDRRVTKWILSRNDEELSAERKKSMLSVIYPYHYNFSVVENGDNYVYLAIDRYYNSMLRFYISQLLMYDYINS